MIINRGLFLASLDKCLIEGKDSIFYIINNAILSTSVMVPFAFPEEITMTVRAVDFHNLIKKFSTETIDLSIKDNKIIVKSGKAKATLAILADAKKIIPPEIFSWNDLPANFMEALQICLIGNNTSQYAGIFLSGNIMCSSDGKKINHIFLDSSMEGVAWINDTAVKNILKIGSFTQYSNMEGLLYFKTNDGIIFSVKKLNGESFPFTAIEKYIALANSSGDRMNVPVELGEVLNRAMAISVDNNSTTVAFTLDDITITCEQDNGKYEESITWNNPEDAIEKTIKVNAQNLLYGLKRGKYFGILEIERGKEKINTIAIYSDNSIHIVLTLQE